MRTSSCSSDIQLKGEEQGEGQEAMLRCETYCDS